MITYVDRYEMYGQVFTKLHTERDMYSAGVE